MDVRHRGKTWMGNFYQKFETMCHEVDDFVSQDTVKYVENQVQGTANFVGRQVHTVGENVKRFCSDVVQDLLPNIVDTVDENVQEEPPNQRDSSGTYDDSTISCKEKSVVIDGKQSCLEQDQTEHLEDHHESSSTIVCPIKQIPSYMEDPVGAAVTEFSSGQDDGGLVKKNLFMGTGENVMGEEQSSCEGGLSSGDKDSFEASSSSEAIDGNESVANFSGTKQSSQSVCSAISCGTKVVESGLGTSSCSLSVESCNLSEFSHASFPLKADNLYYNPAHGSESVSVSSSVLSSSEIFPTVASGSKVVDMGMDFSNGTMSLESSDTSRTDEEVSVAGSSGTKHDMCCKCTELEAYLSSLETGLEDNVNVDITDPSLETIDLSEKMKLDESCVLVDNKLLHTVYCTARKHRSYKKMIQDAFAPRKRLSKEYELLGIWYEDSDVEATQQRRQHLSPLMPTSPVLKNSATHDLCDSEWELL